MVCIALGPYVFLMQALGIIIQSNLIASQLYIFCSWYCFESLFSFDETKRGIMLMECDLFLMIRANKTGVTRCKTDMAGEMITIYNHNYLMNNHASKIRYHGSYLTEK